MSEPDAYKNPQCASCAFLPREKVLNVLSHVAQLLSSQAGAEPALSSVLESLEQELGMERGTVLLLSPDRSELRVGALSDPLLPEQETVRYRKGEGIVGKVLETGEPAIIPRISEEPEFGDRIHHRRESGGDQLSFVCVPIRVGNEVIGTLSADFQQSDSLADAQQVLSIVASMVASEIKVRREEQQAREVLEAENLRLRNEVADRFRPENIIGNSHAMKLVYERIHQVAASDTTVLIRGESGTGKELAASAIHYNGPRAKQPFVKVNCAALSETLIESELFGHEKGSFTGAFKDRVGRIEEAEGGTLFLDEIGEFSLAVQIMLLRVIQEREFQRVGSNRVRKANVRIIAATNRDLEAALAQGLFRQDFYYRINVFPIVLPPLRDRKDDLLQLADHLVRRYGRKLDKPIHRISTMAINMMQSYHWPGNVRELENCIEYAVLLSTDGVIHGHDLPPTLQTPDANKEPMSGSLQSRIDVLEKDAIIDALKRTSGNVTAASRDLGITARMVRYKIEKLGIEYRKLFNRSKKKSVPVKGDVPT
ncbi:MAG: sigma 54-interacting transcriptional regulator [Acidobacteriota bacterium]|nr:sigma 54-interacting transcriptional regulator [Acidobacteriota bacterium]